MHLIVQNRIQIENAITNIIYLEIQRTPCTSTPTRLCVRTHARTKLWRPDHHDHGDDDAVWLVVMTARSHTPEPSAHPFLAHRIYLSVAGKPFTGTHIQTPNIYPVQIDFECQFTRGLAAHDSPSSKQDRSLA